jgi:hypothetical protein
MKRLTRRRGEGQGSVESPPRREILGLADYCPPKESWLKEEPQD